ncbi:MULTISPECIES: hypothetical protein [Bacillus]|uniref:hypothetical protein n=1 Tax=Bacillus TaxID=1386 RepID=UPI0017C11217|nr:MULTISPECIES: hypothetical protein [Bacillus]MDI3409730.1 hypothetical protein [Bacillus sonorensis]MEC0340044.1 hypothetical protein [Bacillus sonorensis]MEC0425721.1 hypothetical protein [Bacillus sonorensis]MEC0458580.1 hypothetical protein [Bacillus sonorensis]MEC0528157.1 hypothetical protein [Bacillus sonorensis]
MGKELTEVDLELIDKIRKLSDVELGYLKGWVYAKLDSGQEQIRLTEKEVS